MKEEEDRERLVGKEGLHRELAEEVVQGTAVPGDVIIIILS